MNATSLFISTTRLVLLADVSDEETWSDLFRLLPYLRQSLSCTVCEKLLKDPYTPDDNNCQHHVCKKCKNGKKKLKPACNWCKEDSGFSENRLLRIHLQSYKKLCEYTMENELFNKIVQRSQCSDGEADASKQLLEFIKEGAKYVDNYETEYDLSSTYRMLPNAFANPASQSAGSGTTTALSEARTKTLSDGTEMYSVSYHSGSGNKITIKRKAPEEVESNEPHKENSSDAPVFKKPQSRKSLGKRKGCRCGNATATPGKLTCCGQRCPCYVESKPCNDCKCKGCRNPHRSVGFKVCPIINLEMPKEGSFASLPFSIGQDTTTSSSSSLTELPTNLTIAPREELSFKSINLNAGNIKVFTPSQLKEVTTLPTTITIANTMVTQPLKSAAILRLPSFHPKVKLQTINLEPEFTLTRNSNT